MESSFAETVGVPDTSIVFEENLSPVGSPLTLTVTADSASAITGQHCATPHRLVSESAASVPSGHPPSAVSIESASSSAVTNLPYTVTSAAGIRYLNAVDFESRRPSSAYQPAKALCSPFFVDCVARSVMLLLAAYGPAPDTVPTPLPKVLSVSTG